MLYRYFMFRTLFSTSTKALARRGIIFGLSLGLILGGAHVVLAAAPDPTYGLGTTAGHVGINTANSPKLTALVGTIIKTLLGLTGVLFLAMIVVAGDYWITAGGNAKQVEDAQTMIKNGIIGLVVVFAAYAVTTFVLTQLLNYVGIS